MARWPLVLRRATEADQDDIIRLINDAVSWLRTQKTDQWSRPWPSRAGRDNRILADLQARRTWIGWDNGTPAATITVDPHPNVAWPDELRREPAVYVHRLVVSRPYARVGLGGQLLDWAGWKASREHRALWVRLNAWTTNHRLHDYYKKQGFEICGHSPDEGYPSGVMFQRPAEDAQPPESNLFWEDPQGPS